MKIKIGDKFKAKSMGNSTIVYEVIYHHKETETYILGYMNQFKSFMSIRARIISRDGESVLLLRQSNTELTPYVEPLKAWIPVIKFKRDKNADPQLSDDFHYQVDRPSDEEGHNCVKDRKGYMNDYEFLDWVPIEWNVK